MYVWVREGRAFSSVEYVMGIGILVNFFIIKLFLRMLLKDVFIEFLVLEVMD